MAYIGNGRTLLIFGPNAQDDIVPDGVSSTFNLSQEVPGGYEGNVVVVRKRYLLDQLIVENGGAPISLVSPNRITTINTDVAAALSIVQAPTTDNDSSNIHISGSGAGNDGVYRVASINYTGDQIEIFIIGTFFDEYNAPIDVSWGRTTEWEVLEPELDYVIGGVGNNTNQEITFQAGYIPAIDDKIYVIHKGDATYNFVPSQASVGPDQLQQNLRNFVCDRYVGDGTTTTFALSQFAVNAKTLLVYQVGTERDGDDPDQSFIGDWSLALNGLSITFASPPNIGNPIKILHLGFSTVARRASLSPGQAGLLAPGTVNNAALSANSVTTDKIAPGAVQNSDIGSDAVGGSKILLNNEENLRGKDFGGTARGLLKINASDQTVLNSQGDTLLQVAGVTKIKLDNANSALSPEVTNTIALGTATKKYSALFVQGTASLGATDVTTLSALGNITVTGNVILPTGGATVDGVDLTALKTQVDQLALDLLAAVPTGTMKMWMVDGATPAGYLLCQGQVVSQATYSNLFSVLSTTFNTGGEGGGNFRIPDLRQRFPIGKAASGTGSLWGPVSGVGGSIDHTHTSGAHTHDLSSHTHAVPGHFHAQDTGGGGSTLAITGLSGTHTTNIDISHGHTASSLGSSTGASISQSAHAHTINISDPGHAHSVFDPGHTHGMAGMNANANHSHTGSTNTDGSHNHATDTSRGAGVNSGSTGKPDKNDGNVTANTGTMNIDTASSTHSHAFTTNTANVDHSHTIYVNGTGVGTNGIGTGVSAVCVPTTANVTFNDASHSHTITVNALGATNKTDISGVHTHAANTFSGSIGNVAGGISGNSNFSTFGPSAANTGSAGAVTTTSNNPPFHTVHFIIKT